MLPRPQKVIVSHSSEVSKGQKTAKEEKHAERDPALMPVLGRSIFEAGNPPPPWKNAALSEVTTRTLPSTKNANLETADETTSRGLKNTMRKVTRRQTKRSTSGRRQNRAKWEERGQGDRRGGTRGFLNN